MGGEAGLGEARLDARRSLAEGETYRVRLLETPYVR